MQVKFGSSGAKLGLAAAIATLAVVPAQASFLDVLFGRSPTQVRYYEPEGDPLNVTVRKRKPKKKTAIPKDAPPVLQKSTLDPAKDPHWYLKDHTLRRGDIVVLPNRVLVMRGSASDLRPSAFEDIRTSAGVSGRERARILAITHAQPGLPKGFTTVPEAAFSASSVALRTDRSSVPVIMP
jgi:hypothetical protein